MTVLNRTAAADFLGIAKTTLDEWVADGAPVLVKPGKKGIESQYESADLVRWWIDREIQKVKNSSATGEDLDELRAKKIEVETEIRQLQLAKEKGEVCRLDELERMLSTLVIHTRTQLLTLPQRLTPLLVGETDETRLKQVIRDEVEQALNELTETNVDYILEESSQW